ncbi:hypothetical protein SO802_027490 [Lithocarpus litseifolius]|uniref:DUF7745 domain-containing protein n=1 Tax=Lithocarpus litseifolius TaxID=425828 RepID=A0AAW2C8C5_9ROSI
MANKNFYFHSTIHDINRWVFSFDFSIKTNFTAFKLKGIKALRNIKIKWDFLRVAVKFWDTKDHVFQFQTAELCPTIEEFSAILGYNPGKKLVAISCDPRHRENLSDALGLRSSITNSMIKGPGFVDARAISVVNQIKDDDNLVPLILAETLLGLDSVFQGGESQNFLGSPLALQIWLMERLEMIATFVDYGPENFLSRTILKIECQIESDWVKFLNKKSNASIRWNCYWWKCPPPLLRFLGSDHIFLVGLRKATFYKDDRLLRQFQYNQELPGGKRRKPFTPVDTNPNSIKNMLLGLEMAN